MYIASHGIFRLFGISIFAFLIGCGAAENTIASDTVRLAVVNTPQDSGLLDALLAGFTAETGLTVAVYSGSDVFAKVRRYEADLVIAHYGKSGMAEWMQSGKGSWPQMVFANQAVLIGPADDPANVLQTHSLEQAFRAIEQSGHKLIANNNEGINELTDTILAMLGYGSKPDWYQDAGVSKGQAIKAADKHGAYVLWGAVPFLKFQQKQHTDMQIVLAADPLLQRVMSISRVLPAENIPVNTHGAKKLEAFLLRADIQAKISQFRMPGVQLPLWWPAARHN